MHPRSPPGSRSIEILAPNGDRPPFHPGHAIPLGSAVHVVDALEVHDPQVLYDVTRLSPWAPIAVSRTTQAGFKALFEAWRSSQRLPALLRLSVDPLSCVHAGLHNALRAEGPPHPEEVAEWIRERTLLHTLGSAILDEILEANRHQRNSRHKLFARNGPLRARGWKNLFRLAQALSHPEGASIEAIAGSIDRDARTLRALSEELLGLPFSLARTGFGWRWAVELVLRKHGYLGDVEPVSCSVGLD